MIDRELISQKVQEHFQQVWRDGDPWAFDASPFEQQRFAHLVRMLEGRRYQQVLELGCGAGALTQRLAGLAGRVLALDIAPAAIERARASGKAPAHVEFRVGNIMEFDPHREGPWDLIVMTETIYCLGWLYPMFDVGWMAAELFAATRQGGRLLLSNAFGAERDYLMRPCLIRTYRDLFLNAGYGLAAEEVFRGEKDGVCFEVLSSLFSADAR